MKPRDYRSSPLPSRSVLLTKRKIGSGSHNRRRSSIYLKLFYSVSNDVLYTTSLEWRISPHVIQREWWRREIWRRHWLFSRAAERMQVLISAFNILKMVAMTLVPWRMTSLWVFSRWYELHTCIYRNGIEGLRKTVAHGLETGDGEDPSGGRKWRNEVPNGVIPFTANK